MFDERDRMIQKQAELITRLNKQIEEDRYYYGDLKRKAAANANELAFVRALDSLITKDENIKEAFESMMLLIRMGHSEEFDQMMRLEKASIRDWTSGRIF